MNDDTQDPDRKPETKNGKTDIERPAGVRALIGWLFLLAYSLSFGIFLYASTESLLALVLVPVMVAGLVLSGILFTPLGVIAAAIMAVVLTIQNNPLNALLAVGTTYAIASVGHAVLITFIWRGKTPEIFKLKRLDELQTEPFSESYRMVVESIFWDLYWGGIEDEFTGPVADNSSLLVTVPDQLKVLAEAFNSDERQREFAAMVGESEGQFAQLVKNRLSVTTEHLNGGHPDKDVAMTRSTQTKRQWRLFKAARASGADGMSLITVTPEVRIDTGNTMDNGIGECDYEIGLRWQVTVHQTKGKNRQLFDDGGTIRRGGRLGSSEDFIDVLMRELRRSSEELPAAIDAALPEPTDTAAGESAPGHPG